MMTSTRQKMLQSKVYKAVLWVILFSMTGGTLLFTPTLFKKIGGLKPVVLTVNNRDITYQTVEQKVANQLEHMALLRQQLGEYADALLESMGDPKNRALEMLIKEELLNQVADTLNLEVSPEYVKQKLLDPSFVMQDLRAIIPFYVIDQQHGVINTALLKQYIARSRLSLADFEKQIEDILRRNMVSNLVGSSLHISPNEIKNYFMDHYVGKKYAILKLPLETYNKEVRTKQLSNQELENFFATENKQSKRYWIPEKRSAMVWRFNPHMYGITISDSQIENYYNINKQKKFVEIPQSMQVRRLLFDVAGSSDQHALEQRIQKVKEELAKDPSRFTALVQEYSDDKETAKKGGLITLKKGERDPAFERAAFRLAKDGDVSEVVMTKDGIEFIQRVSKKPATYKPLDMVKAEIKEILLLDQFQKNFTNDVDRIIDQINQDKQVFENLVAQKKASNEPITLKEKNNTMVMQKLFKTKRGDWAFVIDEKGQGIVLQVTEIQKSHEPTLDMVKKQVQEDLYNQKAGMALREAIQKAKEQAKTTAINTVKERFGGSLEITGFIKQDNKEQLQALDKKGYPVRHLLSLGRTGSLATTESQDAGYIMSVAAVEPFDETAFASKKNEIGAVLYHDKKELLIRGFIASLLKNATIKAVSQDNDNAPQIPLDELPL